MFIFICCIFFGALALSVNAFDPDIFTEDIDSLDVSDACGSSAQQMMQVFDKMHAEAKQSRAVSDRNIGENRENCRRFVQHVGVAGDMQRIADVCDTFMDAHWSAIHRDFDTLHSWAQPTVKTGIDRWFGHLPAGVQRSRLALHHKERIHSGIDELTVDVTRQINAKEQRSRLDVQEAMLNLWELNALAKKRSDLLAELQPEMEVGFGLLCAHTVSSTNAFYDIQEELSADYRNMSELRMQACMAMKDHA